MWSVDYSLIEAWLDEQDEETVAGIFAALELLQSRGPALGRPLVDAVKGSSLRNMKELRPASVGRSEVRILFAFDPERKAVMLLGGDKSKGRSCRSKWAGWYRRAIPLVERRYEWHLDQLGGHHGRARGLS